MSKKIAPRGENGKPELREVLARLAKVTEEAAGFLSRYFEAWESSDHAEMQANLWHGEPHFAELMENLHRAMEDAWALADKNRDAWYFVYTVPPISRRNSDMKYVRRALEVTSMVASFWLATHPVENDGFLTRAVGYLLDKASDKTVVTIAVIALYIHYPWWVLRGKKRIDEND